MSKQAVSTPKAPEAIGPYSQGIVAGNLIFVSGQLPFNPATGEMPLEVSEQACQALENLKAVLEAAGSGLNDVVKVTIFLQHMAHFSAVNEVYAEFFKPPYPARSCIQAGRIPKEALLEIEAIALRA